MKEKMPTWPQMAVIAFFSAAVVFCSYLLANHRERVAGAMPLVAVVLVLAFFGLFLSIFLFYLRPLYGSRAYLVLAAFLAGHLLLVLLLWRIGALG